MSAESDVPSNRSAENERHPLAVIEAEPGSTAQRIWHNEREQLSGLAVAALVHLLLLALLLRAPDNSPLGDQGTEIEAVAVSIVTSIPNHGVMLATTAPAEPMNPSPPEPEESDDASKQQTIQEMRREAAAELAMNPEPVPQMTAEITLPEKPPIAEEPKEKVEVESAEDPKAAQPKPAVATPPPQPPPSFSAAPVSVGTMQVYARQLALALAKTKPRGTGVGGTVKLRFIVENDGRPVSTSVIETSGRAHLDELAVAAISRNVFPPPPAGATEMQRTFVVPYSFR